MKSTEQVNNELLEKFPFLEVIGEYTGANNRILIRCNDCGYEWEAIPRSVMKSLHGCKKCKIAEAKRNQSLNRFLTKFNNTNFDLIEFKDSSHITLKCKVCGYIRTTNASNIYKYGCPKCGQERTHNAQRLTKELFIEKVEVIHRNKYDYSKVEYINYSTPVIIICPIHGEFALMPSKHLLGHGCLKCAGRNLTTEDVISKAKEVHKDKYDYSKTEYINSSIPITIICPKHGEFKLLVGVHIHMLCGCPKCKLSHGELQIELFLKGREIKYSSQYRVRNPYFKEDSSKTFIIDFYLPEYNLFIEYNGEQHYVPKKYFGGELKFKKQQNRDKDLRKYCTENGVNLLEIRFDNKNIPNTILNYIQTLPFK